jgi:hypothetical protein
VIAGIDPCNGILAALGHPWRAVRPDNHSVGGGALAEIDQLECAIQWIEPAQRSVALAAEPDRAIGGGRDIARAHAGGDRIIFYPERAFLCLGAAQQRGRGEDGGGGRGEKLAAIHCVTPSL